MSPDELRSTLEQQRRALARALALPSTGGYAQGAADARRVLALQLRIRGLEMQAEGWDARAYAGRELCAFADGIDEDALVTDARRCPRCGASASIEELLAQSAGIRLSWVAMCSAHCDGGRVLAQGASRDEALRAWNEHVRRAEDAK